MANHGIAVVAVHGTFVREADWLRSGQPLREALARQFPTALIDDEFAWSGGNRQSERYSAAIDLVSRLKRLAANYDSVFVIGHSHGGNVALQALSMCQPVPNLRLVTFHTPFFHVTENDAEGAVSIALGVISALVYIAVGALVFLSFISPSVRELQLPWLQSLFAFVFVAGVAYVGLILLAIKAGLNSLISKVAAQLVATQTSYRGISLTYAMPTLVVGYPTKDRVVGTLASAGRRSISATEAFDSANAQLARSTDFFVRYSRRVYLILAAVLVLALALFFYSYFLAGSNPWMPGLWLALALAFTAFVGAPIWMGLVAVRVAIASMLLVRLSIFGLAASFLRSFRRPIEFLVVRVNIDWLPAVAGPGSRLLEWIALDVTGRANLKSHYVNEAESKFKDVVSWMAQHQ